MTEPTDLPAERHIYLLIEESFRELSSRLLIAAQLAAPGTRVWIGQQWWFASNFEHLPPGTVFFKGNNRVQVVNMRRAQLAGHKVASIEEEAFGLSAFDGEKTYDPRSAGFCDLFCVQGQSLADYIADMASEAGTRIAITGNPRADLLRAPHDEEIRERAAAIRQAEGQFVLINTNQASINPYDLDAYNYWNRCVEAGVYDAGSKNDSAAFDRLLAWEHENLSFLSEFIARWPDFSDLPLVLRPHPSEWAGLWHTAMQAFGHVKVVEDTDHLAWTAAAIAMVHTSSTTGLEACLLGTPAVNLKPRSKSLSDNFLASHVNESFDRTEEACRFLARLTGTEDRRSLTQSGINHWLTPHLRVDDAHTAARHVADALLSLDTPAPRERKPGPFVAISNSPRQLAKAGFDAGDVYRHLDGIWQRSGRSDRPAVTTVAPSVFAITVEKETVHV